MKNVFMQAETRTIAVQSMILREAELMEKWRARGAKANEDRDRHLVHFEKIHNRRTDEVRREARNRHIAYGFLNGQAYREIEEISYVQPNWGRIQELVLEYGGDDSRTILQKFSEWLADAANGAEILANGGVKGKNGKAIQPKPHSVRGQWICNDWLLRDFGGDINKFNIARAERLIAIEEEHIRKYVKLHPEDAEAVAVFMNSPE